MIVLAAVAAAADPDTDAGTQERWWAGEQVTEGVRRVPILGDVKSRTTVHLLAVALRHA